MVDAQIVFHMKSFQVGQRCEHFPVNLIYPIAGQEKLFQVSGRHVQDSMNDGQAISSHPQNLELVVSGESFILHGDDFIVI